MRRFPLHPITFALLMLPAAAWSQRFTLLTVPLETNFVNIHGIGDGGHLVGSYLDAEAGEQAFRMDRRGTLAGLQGGAMGSAAYGVNAAGEMVGYVVEAGVVVAARWSAGGVLSTLPMTIGYGINDAGEVAGQVESSAARWSPNRGLELLQGGGPDRSVGRAINAAGTVVGATYLPFETRATLWRVDQPPLDLGALTGSAQSYATAINAQGWVAGYGHTGFLWDEANGMRDLAGLVPVGLNAAGQVVGGSEESSRPLLWNERTGSHDLGAMTGHAGVVGTVGINRHAQVGLRTIVDNTSGGALLTLHPDWDGGSGAWHDGEHWNWAGTGIAPAQLGEMHAARIAVADDTRVQLDADASVLSLDLRASEGANASFELLGRRLYVEGLLVVGAGGVLVGNGTLAAGASVVFEPGGALVLDAGEVMHFAAPLALDGGVLRMQLGSRLVVDGEATLSNPRLELRLGADAPQAGQRFDLIDWNGPFVQAPESWSMLQPLLPSGLVWNADQLWIDGSVTIQAVPEPANAALLALGLGILAWRRLAHRTQG